MSYKLGRLPATRPFGLSDLGTYATGKLAAPPASVNVPDASYPIDGNDTYGDCVMAGTAHMIAAWDKEVAEADKVPSSTSVVEEYFKLTGGEDTGLNEADVLATWHKVGLFGSKIEGYAPVGPKNIVEIHQAIAFYGGCMLGIECPESAQEQFQNSKPWTYVPGSPVEGGHCIVALGYSQTALLCATWGGIAEVTLGFIAHFLDEAWAILPQAFVEHKGDALGIDLATLQADLKAV